METKKFYKFAAAILCTVFAIAITSCSNDDDNNSALKFTPSSVTVAVGASQTLDVSGGTEAYTVKSSDEKIAKASVSKSTIIVSGIKAGKAIVMVTDSKKASGTFNVTVADGVVVDKPKVSVATDKEQTVNISGGTAPYSVSVKDATIATASVKDNSLTIKGVKAGSTTVTVTDKDKKMAMVAVTVTK